MEVLEIASRAGKYDDLIRYLQMARKTIREPQVDGNILLLLAKIHHLHDFGHLLTQEEADSLGLVCLLRINKGHASPFNRRVISLHPGDHIVLGRVSKNQKTEFTAKSINGYFDNPIISRRHAYLQNRAGLVKPPNPSLLVVWTVVDGDDRYM